MFELFGRSNPSRGSSSGGGGGSTPGSSQTSPINAQTFPISLADGEGAIALNGDAFGVSVKRGPLVVIGAATVQSFVPCAPDTSKASKGFGFVPDCKMRAGSMQMIFRQVSGFSNFRYYLMRNTGMAPVVIAKTARFTPILGLLSVPFETPVDIEPDSIYYMGYYCDDPTGNIRYLLEYYNSDSPTSPVITCSDANELNLGNSLGIGNPTQFRPWMSLNEEI